MKNRQKVVKINLLGAALDGMASKKDKQRHSRIKLSLLACLMGIFLLPQVAYFSSISPERIIELTNVERTKAGLPKLTANQLLTKAAYAKGQDILKTQVFQHNINGKKFSAWVRDAGYNYSYTGENLAVDFLTSEGAVEAWMDSPTHKANLLSSDFTEIGVAAVEGKFNGQMSIVIVEIFGNPPMTIARASMPESSHANLNVKTSEDAENLLTHSIAGSQNLNLIPDMKEKISLDNEAVMPPVRPHLGNIYIDNLITPFKFMPIATGIVASIALAYLYITNLAAMIRLARTHRA